MWHPIYWVLIVQHSSICSLHYENMTPGDASMLTAMLLPQIQKMGTWIGLMKVTFILSFHRLNTHLSAAAAINNFTTLKLLIWVYGWTFSLQVIVNVQGYFKLSSDGKQTDERGCSDLSCP